MKKFLLFTVSALGALAFAGCTGCFGCSGCNSDNKTVILTSSNWYAGTSYQGIQPSIISDDDFPAEKITYTVTHSEGGNKSYSAEYKDGEFTTEFFATRYDWGASTIPEEVRDSGKELVYCYKTSLKISVRFKKDESYTAWFNDSVSSVAYFRAAGKNLQPVYSKQDVKSTTPAVYNAGEIEKCYNKVDRLYENFYNKECTSVLSLSTDRAENTSDKKTHGDLNKHDGPVFDNCSLYIVARSLNLNESLSQNIYLYSAAAGGVDSYNVTCKDKKLSDEEQASAESKLQASKLYVPEGENPALKTIAADINYLGTLSGVTQTVWYAQVTNPENNVPRATMLKISAPISYNLGVLTYNLQSVTSNLWNE